MSDFQTWYNASQANRDYYHAQTGTQPQAVDWNALRQMTNAGLSSADIRRLAREREVADARRRMEQRAAERQRQRQQNRRTTSTRTTTSRPNPARTTTTRPSGHQQTTTVGQLIDPTTGRPAWTGPNGEGGLAHPPTAAQIRQYGQFSSHVMPDGRVAYYVPGYNIQEGNLMALENWARQHEVSDEEEDGGLSAEEQELNNRSAHALIQQTLDRYGLGGLSGWAMEQIRNKRSHAEVLLELRERPEFKTRFKAIDLRRQNGLNAVSPDTIIEYENTARDLMRQSGLPKGFYDQFDDFAELIGKGVSLQSVARRIEQSWDRVVNAPGEVRKAFNDLYGIRGDQALAALMFDPDKGEQQLEKMARSAVAGGAMRAAGFGLDAVAAGRLAGFDFDDKTVRGGFARLAQLRAVFEESMGEQEDLDAMREGINSVFDIGEGSEAIARRIDTRVNEFAGGGGAYATREGLTGLRSY